MLEMSHEEIAILFLAFLADGPENALLILNLRHYIGGQLKISKVQTSTKCC